MTVGLLARLSIGANMMTVALDLTQSRGGGSCEFKPCVSHFARSPASIQFKFGPRERYANGMHASSG